MTAGICAEYLQKQNLSVPLCLRGEKNPEIFSGTRPSLPLSTSRQSPQTPTQSPAQCTVITRQSTDAHAMPARPKTATAPPPTTPALQNIQTSKTLRARDASAPEPNNPAPAAANEYPHPLSIRPPPAVRLSSR